MDHDEVATWARRWDDAVFQLKGCYERFGHLSKVTLASHPPHFGKPVYNTGHPLGTPLKVSLNAHVLRHSIYNDDERPFSHTISPGGTYSTDLDQFPGELL